MRYFAIYNPTTKIAQGYENYNETDVSEDGRILYLLNRERYKVESKNRVGWNYFDDTVTFASKFSGYGGDVLPNSLLLIGDSRTAMWAGTTTKYFTEYTNFSNRGIAGDTAHHQMTIIPSWGLSKYKKAVISIGINDWGFDYTSTVVCINNIATQIKNYAETVYLTNIPTINSNVVTVLGMSVDDANLMRGHALYVNLYIEQICKDNGITFIDLAGLMDDTNKYLKTTYDYSDGLHYNEAGYAAIRQLYTSKGV